MSILVAILGRDNAKLVAQLQAGLPNISIQEWPNCKYLDEVEFVLAWKAPDAMWAQLPNLKAVSSFGAGVDSIDLNLIPEHVDVVRIVDHKLSEDMAEYVLCHVLAQKLRLKEYLTKQEQQYWKPKRAYSYKNIGILGYGELGKACAKTLVKNNFNVSAWSNSKKISDDVSLFNGEQGLSAMLEKTDYLICLLPLTKATQGIINKQLLDKLPDHGVVINVGRGQHVIEEDLLNALNTNSLRAATLDVFEQEPLPEDHPYWPHPKITLTPHCASLSDLNSVSKQIIDNVERLKQGLELNNKIDRAKGY